MAACDVKGSASAQAAMTPAGEAGKKPKPRRKRAATTSTKTKPAPEDQTTTAAEAPLEELMQSEPRKRGRW